MLNDFKKFVMRGNVLELAVAVILGAAFGAVVLSFTNDILMAFLGAIVGEPNFNNLTFDVGDAVIYYGNFLTVLVNFLIIAFSLFLVIKAVEKLQSMRASGEEEPEALTRSEELLVEIRDLLRPRD
jgi:large conductance mechanosensitive channel